MAVDLVHVVPGLAERASFLVQILQSEGFPATITSGFRPPWVQAALYQRYLEGRSPYPVAPSGKSKHEQGLAFDMSSSPEGLAIAGFLAPYLDLFWGGNFGNPDPVHFEVA